MSSNTCEQTFFSLLRAGLWEKTIRLLPFDKIDFTSIHNLAQEQSVIGLIAAGLEHVEGCKLAKQDVMQFAVHALQIEQQNLAMNCFIGVLIDKMRTEGIETLLVKGQGIAQCYERPLWRSCGDVDFFLSDVNYELAKQQLIPLATSVDPEEPISKHLGMIINHWSVELHGSLRCGLSVRMDRELEDIKNDVIYRDNVRSWDNGGTQVFLLGAENDAIYVFSHILNHYYRGGVGVRQICDWCRLLWVYRNDMDLRALESRILKMGMLSEWRAFGAFAVEYLGMPSYSMPLYSQEQKWKRKADKICSFIMEAGNFGHNRNFSYYLKYPFLIRKAISLGLRISDIGRHALVFPLDSFLFLPYIIINGIRSSINSVKTHDI